MFAYLFGCLPVCVFSAFVFLCLLGLCICGFVWRVDGKPPQTSQTANPNLQLEESRVTLSWWFGGTWGFPSDQSGEGAKSQQSKLTRKVASALNMAEGLDERLVTSNPALQWETVFPQAGLAAPFRPLGLVVSNWFFRVSVSANLKRTPSNSKHAT